MKIVLVHGFNVRDGGSETVDRLADYLEEAGHQVESDQADYGFFSLWMVRFRKHSAVLRIAEAIQDADAVVSHSNGANYAHKALKLVQHNDRQYLEVRLSPALNRSTAAAPGVTQCTVFHTLTDFWVWLSGFLPWHPWGRQGQRGYKGPDDRMRNWNMSDIVRGHSDYFTDENVKYISSEVLLALESS